MLTNDQLWRKIQALKGHTVYTPDEGRVNIVVSTVINRVVIDGKSAKPTLDQLFKTYTVVQKDGYMCKCNSPFFKKVTWRILMALLAEAVPEEIKKFPRSHSPLPCGHSGIALKES